MNNEPSLAVSVLVPVINEVESLRETIQVVMKNSSPDIAEILILTADRTEKESLAVIEEMKNEFGDRIREHRQSRPFLGGALGEGFEHALGDYVLMMASDLETDPSLVPELIEVARQTGADIVCTTRWSQGGSFEGYHPVKWALNWAFQKFFSTLFHTRLTDLTFGYRLYKKRALDGIIWEEMRHGFLFESLIKPLAAGARAVEIPTHWTPRVDAESTATWGIYWGYFRIGFKVKLGELGLSSSNRPG
jgi:glycosyltransferase involved in cell wall biosynthesis